MATPRTPSSAGMVLRKVARKSGSSSTSAEPDGAGPTGTTRTACDMGERSPEPARIGAARSAFGVPCGTNGQQAQPRPAATTPGHPVTMVRRHAGALPTQLPPRSSRGARSMSLLFRAAAGPSLTISVLHEMAELERLRGEWEQLLARSSGLHPSLTPTWLLTWWRVFGPLDGRRLRILAVREGRELVGLFPLLERRHWLPPPRADAPPRARSPRARDREDEILSEYLGPLAAAGREARGGRGPRPITSPPSASTWEEMVFSALEGRVARGAARSSRRSAPAASPARARSSASARSSRCPSAGRTTWPRSRPTTATWSSAPSATSSAGPARRRSVVVARTPRGSPARPAASSTSSTSAAGRPEARTASSRRPSSAASTTW